jgi:hypothetical protein
MMMDLHSEQITLAKKAPLLELRAMAWADMY